MSKTILKESDYIDFYKTMLYGDLSNPIEVAIRSAYRDFCRTIHGFSKHERHDEIYKKCREFIRDEVALAINDNDIISQEDFDFWHKNTCDKLIEYSENIFSYGQAQKWINMTLKYISMFNHKNVENLYEYFHVPIDNYILELTKYKTFDTAWSKINSYDKYIDFQKWFRKTYDGIPLDVEFKMWIEASREKRNYEGQ